MKINAISPNYSMQRAQNVRSTRVRNDQPQQVPNKLAVISFKGGNKEQAIFFAAETKPYFQVGGVATVMEDMRTLRVSDNSPVMDSAYKKTFEKWAPKDKVIVDAIYNAQKVYNKDTGMLETIQVAKIPEGLKDSSAFKKYKNMYFMTNDATFGDYTTPLDYFNNEEKIIASTKKPNLAVDKNIFLLEDVTGGKKTIDFGDTGESEVKLFRVLRYDEKTGNVRPTNDFKIFTDLTASMKQPYADGSYSTSPKPLGQTWKGDPYAKLSKAFAELMPQICSEKSKDGVKFDPATVVLNDAQAFWATEYMAEKAVKGDEFWQGKKPTMILHNGGTSYTQPTSYQNMFVNIADKELRSTIENDPKYIEALKRGPGSTEAYFRELLPTEILNAQGNVSGLSMAMHYIDNGYVPLLSTVSEGYQEKLISDPNFEPAYYSKLKDYAAKGKFIGILNAFENEDLNPYTIPNMQGYKEVNHLGKGTIINGEDGFKTKPYVAFDPNKVNENSVDIAHVREVKRQNKISLLERFDKEVLEKLEDLKEVPGHEYDYNVAITGLPNKDVKVYGHIDKKYIEEVKKANSDVKVITSWGRGDMQKGLDSVLNSFRNYVHKFSDKDPNTVLVMGGSLGTDPNSAQVRKILDEMNNDPKLVGRFVYLDGFAPNKPLASAADFAMFPSRFAPCELTDLEAMKVLCAPMVTNCQGLAQKNFDASFAEEVARVTGYKTQHEYAMSYDDLRNSLPDSSSDKKVLDKKALDKAVNKFKAEIKKQHKISHGGQELTEAQIMEIINKGGDLHYKYCYEILKPFRDQVIESELTKCLERALIEDRNKDVHLKMVLNHLKQHTAWEDNAALSKTNLSSAKLYRKNHFQTEGQKINESDTLLYKLRQKCAQAIERSKNGQYGQNGGTIDPPNGKGGGISFKKWFAANKKSAIIGSSLAGLAAIGFVAYKAGWFSPEAEEKPAHNISCVG